VIGPLSPPGRTLRRTRSLDHTWLAIAGVDHAVDLPVPAGLIAAAWPAANPAQRSRAVLTGSRLLAFERLPGVAAADPASPGSTPQSPYVVQVTDPQGRFLPTAMSVLVPQAADAPTYSWLAGDGSGHFYLFPSPGRPAAPGQVALRGTLWDLAGNRPAAHAVVRLQSDGGTWFGLADARGCVAVICPFPTAAASAGQSDGPPGIFAPRTVTVTVQYGAGDALPLLPGAAVPDLLAILGQPQAQLCDSAPDNPVAAVQRSIAYGQDLILRSAYGSAQGYLSVMPRSPQPE
jgi:hypothetical protein